MRLRVPHVLLLLVVCALPAVADEPPPRPWEFLSRSTIGADRFTAENPTWDGRGVLVAVCDTGMELGLPGLALTSDDQPKIVDARVFSDEGVIGLSPARLEEGAWRGEGDRRLRGANAVEPRPAEDAQVLVGWFEERSLRGGDVEDVDRDGRTDGVFGLVAYPPRGGGDWVAVIDTDGDGDLADERALRDFAVARETFHLRHEGPVPSTASEQVTLALNLWPAEQRAAFFFDAGGHGTHVGGIAAGHGLNAQPGFDGIAPGAQILALKIGNTSYAGGATTAGSMLNAWRHAVAKAEELGLPLVITMSYGVGSEHEGEADAERLIDELLAAHPGVVATVSAGNDGPGLSTVGLPAAAREPLTVGAALARTTAEDLYGIALASDRLFPFSARGGELAKPDLVTPGFASSAVPQWHARDVMRGTSMAAPQAAGACALLLSAARAEGLPIRRDLLKAALVRTARELPGYGPLDQGAGMADVPAAWQAYRAFAARDPAQPLEWRVETECAEMRACTGEAVYYRGDFYPRGDERHVARVRPVFPKAATPETRRAFYRALDLVCDADWLRIEKGSTYAKQEQAAEIPLQFVAERLGEPGLYQTRVLAFDKGLSAEERRRLGPEFALPVAVVVPLRFEDDRSGPVVHTVRGLAPAEVARTYLQVPPWCASVRLEGSVRNDGSARAAGLALFDAEGREHRAGWLDRESERSDRTFEVAEIGAGVWELCVTASQDNRGPVDVELTLWGFPLLDGVGGDRAVPLEHSAGAAPHGELDLVPALAERWEGRATGRVVGLVAEGRHDVEGPEFSRRYELAPEERELVLELEMRPEDWNRFTDVAVRLVAADGTLVESTAMGYRKVRLATTHRGPLELKIHAATADPGLAKPRWRLELRETRLYADAVGVRVTQSGRGAELLLWPDRPATLRLDLERTPPARPKMHSWLAEIALEPVRGGPRLPLRLRMD